MQDRRSYGEIRDFGLIVRRHRVHADETEALVAIGPLAQVIPEDRKELGADVGREDLRMREAIRERDHRIARSRSDVDDSPRRAGTTCRIERITEQKIPITRIEVALVVLLGVLQELRRYADLGRPMEALRRIDAREGGRFRSELDKRLGKD